LPYMAILKVLARLTENKLALSEITFNEHCAHYENRLRRIYAQRGKLDSELAELLEVSSRRRMSTKSASSTEIAERAKRQLSSYQEKILEVFDLIRLDGASAIEALRREAWRIPPASISFDTPGSGARDAAIWLSLVSESTDSSETIYLISSDKQAFSNANLDVDLKKTGASVVALNDIGELLKILADDVGVNVDISLIKSSEIAGVKMLQYLGGTYIPSDALSTAIRHPPGVSGWSYSEHDLSRIEFIEAHDIRGHVIGDETWVTGRVRWRVTYSVKVEWSLREDVISEAPKEPWRITFHVMAVILFKVTPAGIDEFEVLNVGKPSHVTGSVEGPHISP